MMIRDLILLIFEKGNFDGIGGVIRQVPLNDFIGFNRKCPSENLWTKVAMQPVKNLVQSAIGHKFDLFEKCYKSLIGLGPGLTPSGDDLLVGFFSAHKLFSSPFAQWLEKYTFKNCLTCLNSNTTPIASQFLNCAVNGVFSETLFDALQEVFTDTHHLIENTDSQDSKHAKIESFLKWGHSSGTDTMAGAALGFWTMMENKNFK
jgi:hypothetical protein